MIKKINSNNKFIRIFLNFISCFLVKRGGPLSFLTIFTFAVPELLDLIYNGKTIQREHIDDYLPKCSNKKYSLSV
jgi:hypothetical protein